MTQGPPRSYTETQFAAVDKPATQPSNGAGDARLRRSSSAAAATFTRDAAVAVGGVSAVNRESSQSLDGVQGEPELHG